jgi:hypothetical protein
MGKPAPPSPAAFTSPGGVAAFLPRRGAVAGAEVGGSAAGAGEEAAAPPPRFFVAVEGLARGRLRARSIVAGVGVLSRAACAKEANWAAGGGYVVA